MPDVTDYNQQWRQDTASNLTTDNPTPRVGEPIVESDTGRWKLGAGSAWNNTDYQDGSLPPGYIFGLETAAAADADHDVTISTGRCRSSDETRSLVLSSSLTKQIDATWAAGDNAGGLFTGTVAADTTYHLFLIFNPTTSTIDAGWDTFLDPTANLPSGYTIYRRIRSYLTDSGPNIIPTKQNGNTFILDPYIADTFPSVSTSRQSVSLSIPSGLKLEARIWVAIESASSLSYSLITDPDNTDSAPSSNFYNAVSSTGFQSPFHDVITTNTSGQIGIRSSAVTGSYEELTMGWIDNRGRFDGI